MTHRVFVYGTLKRGHPNNPLLAGSEFLGEGVTLPTYKMVATSFPAIMPDPGGKPVAGEESNPRVSLAGEFGCGENTQASGTSPDDTTRRTSRATSFIHCLSLFSADSEKVLLNVGRTIFA